MTERQKEKEQRRRRKIPRDAEDGVILVSAHHAVQNNECIKTRDRMPHVYRSLPYKQDQCPRQTPHTDRHQDPHQ
jgi:hypothetical protein